jgi:hypothetical protein
LPCVVSPIPTASAHHDRLRRIFEPPTGTA